MEARTTDGEKVGKVKDVYLDADARHSRYLAVKTGWFSGTHVVPVNDVSYVDRNGDSYVVVPYSAEQLKHAPTFGDDDELTPEREREIYDHYQPHRLLGRVARHRPCAPDRPGADPADRRGRGGRRDRPRQRPSPGPRQALGRLAPTGAMAAGGRRCETSADAPPPPPRARRAARGVADARRLRRRGRGHPHRAAGPIRRGARLPRPADAGGAGAAPGRLGGVAAAGRDAPPALPDGRVEAVPGGLRNVVGTLPGRGRPILVGAHYDTKDIPGFVGANDGASGVAVVLELSRALRAGRRACDREIRFVMFDGEESPAGSPDARFLQDGLRGSRAYAAAHAGELGAAIVVNMVGDRDLSIPREAGSDARLWRMLRGSAERVGAGAAFPPRTAGRILDDHTPFAQRGVPAIDLIDFGYPPWHTRADRLDKVSARSLDLTGEPLADMLQRLARQTCQGG